MDTRLAGYVARRVFTSLLVVLAVSLIAFFGLYHIGDPTEIFMSEEATAQERDAFRAAWALDRPIWVQYAHFLGRAVQGDFAESMIYHRPALDVILERFPATVELTVLALSMTIAIGIPLGIYAGMRPKSLISRAASSVALVALTLPSFWVGIMLILFFAVQLGLFPATGRGDTVKILGVQWSIFTADGLRHAALPAFNLALPNAALLYRLVRAAVMEQKTADYVRFARAKGLPRHRVVLVHIFRNVLLPVITVLGLEFGALMAFAIITESIFAWPGMGRLIIEAINLLDRPLVVTYLMFTVTLIVLINLCVDLCYAVVDPRARVGQ